ncbi:MAG: FtsQ-type POTRA domain-containing protein [Longilinea sp.]|nr:FtsQ-type POTRA domain-containing protein [Longilinea sp.]
MTTTPNRPTRAEQVRQRRAQTTTNRPHQPIGQPAARPARAPRPVSPPPVTVRGSVVTPLRSSATIPVAQKARTQTRRQYYYTLSASGAELRLPAIPNVSFGERGLSALLALVWFILLLFLLQSSTFEVQTVNVRGLERLSSEQITAVLNLEGENIFAINRNTLLTSIKESFPELKDIRLSIGLPAQVTLSATERQPILAWQTGEETLWIDQQGYIFPARGELSTSLPTVESDSLPPLVQTLPTEATLNPLERFKLQPTPQTWGQQMQPQMLDTALRLLPQVPEGASLTYSPFSGLGWNDPNGWSVYIGRSLDNMDIKLLEYQTIVTYLGSQGITPAVISVETIHAPFYRMEP